MSMTVGAALKKVAVARLTDKSTLKKLGTAVLVLLVALLMPIMAMLTVLSGEAQLDVDALMDQIHANLSVSDIAMLTSVENNMNAIETALTDAGLSSRTTEAQALYIMALYDQSEQMDFISRLVSCFQEGQTDAQLISAVNDTFGTSIETSEFTNVMKNYRATNLNTTGFTNPAGKNNLDLVAWAQTALDARWGYVWGTYGQVLTRELFESKLAQFPDDIGVHESFIRANWVGGRTADCIGLIKGYSWYNPETGSIDYGSNGMPDVNADQMYQLATIKGPISTIPEVPGLLVWTSGHIGIYIGNGEVIEAMGTRYGVVKTQLSSRRWTNWCYNPYIDYIDEAEATEPVGEAS